MKNRISLMQFIRENRADIDAGIDAVNYQYDGRGGRGHIPVPAPLHNDDERRGWVLNDEGLYRWAQAAGVRI